MNAALGEVEVRQAINYAIDSDAMLQAVAEGHGTVTRQIFPETSPAYDPALDEAYPTTPRRPRSCSPTPATPTASTLDMPLLDAVGTATLHLVKQYLGDVGITVNYTQLDVNTAITDIIAPKYAATFFQLQNPTWQLIHFSSPRAPRSTSSTTDGPGSTTHRADPDRRRGHRRHGRAEQVRRRPGWFNPWYRVEGNFATDADTERREQATTPTPTLEHQAEGS